MAKSPVPNDSGFFHLPGTEGPATLTLRAQLQPWLSGEQTGGSELFGGFLIKSCSLEEPVMKTPECKNLTKASAALGHWHGFMLRGFQQLFLFLLGSWI